MINLVADRYCPTWTKLTWWDRLLRRKPKRLVFRMPDGTLVCSAETKAFYEANTMLPIEFRDS